MEGCCFCEQTRSVLVPLVLVLATMNLFHPDCWRACRLSLKVMESNEAGKHAGDERPMGANTNKCEPKATTISLGHRSNARNATHIDEPGVTSRMHTRTKRHIICKHRGQVQLPTSSSAEKYPNIPQTNMTAPATQAPKKTKQHETQPLLVINNTRNSNMHSLKWAREQDKDTGTIA